MKKDKFKKVKTNLLGGYDNDSPITDIYSQFSRRVTARASCTSLVAGPAKACKTVLIFVVLVREGLDVW